MVHHEQSGRAMQFFSERRMLMKKISVLILLCSIFALSSQAEAMSISWLRKIPSAISKTASKSKTLIIGSSDDAAKAASRSIAAKSAAKTILKGYSSGQALSPSLTARLLSMKPAQAARATELARIGGGAAVRLFQKHGDDVAAILLKAEKEKVSPSRIANMLEIIRKYGADGIRFINKNWVGLIAGYIVYEAHGVLAAEPGDGSVTGAVKQEVVDILPFLGVSIKLILGILIFGCVLFLYAIIWRYLKTGHILKRNYFVYKTK